MNVSHQKGVKLSKAYYIPTTTELAEASTPFLYELWMFRVSTQAIASCTERALKNMVIESALTHARNLYDFFTGDQSCNDDIVAGHFVETNDDAFWKSSRLPYVGSVKTDINKALSHLTYTRVSYKPSWRHDLIKADIEDAYSEFLRLLPADRRANWQLVENVVAG